MRVLFLDVDGVLNHHDTKERHIFGGRSFVGLDRACVARLHRVLTATGAKVVISSSWRKSLPPERMAAILAEAGCPADVIGATEITGQYEDREALIRDWLVDHPDVTAWIVIDDLYLPGLGDRWIETREDEGGLTDALADAAIARLCPHLDPELTTTERLASLGLTHRSAGRPTRPGEHDVLNADGVVVFTGTAESVNTWLTQGVR